MGMRTDESAVFLNYKPIFDGVSTLAHELGHAYHNLNLADRTPQRDTPMTLAETASIFCETIVATPRSGPRRGPSSSPSWSLPPGRLPGRGRHPLAIPIRAAGLRERRERELSVDELTALMLQAQRETYGDGLDADACTRTCGR